MRAEQSKFLASVDASVDDDDPEFGQESEKPDVSVSAEQSETVCSLCHDSSSSVPISFLTLLQVCDRLFAFSINFILFLHFGFFCVIEFILYRFLVLILKLSFLN